MLLVHGLACHPEGFGHLGPGPALAHRALDFSVLESIGHRPESGGGREPISRTAERRRASLSHPSNFSCLVLWCQPVLLMVPLAQEPVKSTNGPVATPP